LNDKDLTNSNSVWYDSQLFIVFSVKAPNSDQIFVVTIELFETKCLICNRKISVCGMF